MYCVVNTSTGHPLNRSATDKYPETCCFQGLPPWYRNLSLFSLDYHLPYSVPEWMLYVYNIHFTCYCYNHIITWRTDVTPSGTKKNGKSSGVDKQTLRYCPDSCIQLPHFARSFFSHFSSCLCWFIVIWKYSGRCLLLKWPMFSLI